MVEQNANPGKRLLWAGLFALALVPTLLVLLMPMSGGDERRCVHAKLETLANPGYGDIYPAMEQCRAEAALSKR